jgi:hypothetical protein
MSEANHAGSTGSLYASPQEALKAPPEELLYLASCTRAPACARPTSSP